MIFILNGYSTLEHVFDVYHGWDKKGDGKRWNQKRKKSDKNKNIYKFLLYYKERMLYNKGSLDFQYRKSDEGK